jgi:hypothetical protein
MSVRDRCRAGIETLQQFSRFVHESKARFGSWTSVCFARRSPSRDSLSSSVLMVNVGFDHCAFKREEMQSMQRIKSTRPSKGTSVKTLVESASVKADARDGPEVRILATRSSMKRDLNCNLSRNEVYYTARSSPVILKNSCSRLHCQRDFGLIPFSYIITSRRKRVG